LLEPNFLWLDSKLTLKNDLISLKKKIKLSSTQIDELEKLERVEQTKFQVSEFLPESDIIDTSVAIAGWPGLGEVVLLKTFLLQKRMHQVLEMSIEISTMVLQ
jgi:hypothetical protein